MPDVLEGRPRLLVHLGAWLLVGALVTLLLSALVGMEWVAAMCFALPLAAAAAPISISGFYLSRALPLRPDTISRVAGTVGSAAIMTGALWAALGYGWWLSLHALAIKGVDPGPAQPQRVTPILIVVGAMAYVVSMAMHYLFRTYERAATVERRALESEIAAREAELRALRAQIDPHFLFNSLNSISGLVGVDPARARSMCQKLGDFLRDSLTLGGAGRIALAREVALVRQYLEIEQVRFGPRLTVDAALSPGAGDAMVPALLLQPLVENAVRHGIATLIEGGVVRISAERSGDKVVIVVANPRDPEAKSRRGTGLGLDIVRRRLAAAFGDEASLTVEPGEHSHRVVITIPAEGKGDG
ncbi:MAG: sensor histidine kinase [Acidobacteria bacterium]|nr:MAG: sensor histidine kinase [Acidobacteriota bacterium]